MFSYIFAFIFGLFIPSIATRYAKTIASDLGEWLFNLVHFPHFPQTQDSQRRTILKQKWLHLILSSIFCAFILLGLFILIDLFISSYLTIWIKTFVTLNILMASIDQRCCLLPDIFTLPLLILGFAYAVYTKQISFAESLTGASYGFLLPAICVFITSVFFTNAFGGGDVKMLSGIGAWLGPISLTYAILISVFSFAITATLLKQKAAPYGPHLALGAIIVILFETQHFIFLS